MVSIVRGNDFILHIPLEKLTAKEGIQTSAPFYPDGAKLTIYLVHIISQKSMPYTVSGNVLSVKVDGTKLYTGVYAIEIVVVKDGKNMRSMNKGQFQIVETNEGASLPGSVEFDVEVHQLESQVFIPFGENTPEVGTSDYDKLENKPRINDVELSGNKTLAELKIQPAGDYVSDSSYVHTDINFTKELKDRLESLKNYDDTKIQDAVSKLKHALETLVDGDVNGVIDSFKEIEAFLSGVTESDSLAKMLSDLRKDILTVIPDWAKHQSKPSYTASEVGALPSSTVIPSLVPLSQSEYDALPDDKLTNGTFYFII